MILCFNPSLFIWAFCPPGSEKTPFVFLLIFSKLILPQDFPTTELLGHSFSGIPNWWQVPIAISTFQIIFLCPMTRTYLQLKEAIWVWSSIVFNSTAACWCHCSGNSIGCTAFKTAKLFFPTKKKSIPRFLSWGNTQISMAVLNLKLNSIALAPPASGGLIACPGLAWFLFQANPLSLHPFTCSFYERQLTYASFVKRGKVWNKIAKKTQGISSCRTQMLISWLKVCKIPQFPNWKLFYQTQAQSMRLSYGCFRKFWAWCQAPQSCGQEL